jgi:anti-sigma-K factor RskA
MDYGRPDLADALAAEYVAGTLRGAARRRFEALLPSHPALQRAVRRWQDRLLPMTSVIGEVTPPDRVWQGIESRLWPEPGSGSVASPQAAREPTVALAAWWQRLAVWRAVSGVAIAALVASLVLLANPPPAPAPIVVVLQGTGADAQVAGTFVASFTADGRAVVTRPIQAVALAEQRVLELWSVPPEGQGGPVSLGLISPSGVTVLSRDRVPAGLLTRATDLLAVSVEPPGGSPTGAPTGPVVFAGRLRS